MSAAQHRYMDVEKVPGGHRAWCACGVETRYPDRALAVAALYKHVLDASRPQCPTPQKRAYPSRLHALDAINRFIKTASPGQRPVRVYECPSGQHWHTTKNPNTTPIREAA